MKKFFSLEREVKSYSPLDSQISSADFSLVINFPHKIFVPSKPATLQLSKMVWHLKIGQKLRVLGAKTWGVMFFQNFWLKLKGAILGPQNHFWWFQRQNGGFPNGYFGFLKKKLKSESAILRLPNSCSLIIDNATGLVWQEEIIYFETCLFLSIFLTLILLTVYL